MAAKRLTRKEIVQEDAIRKTLTETSSWLFKNLNYILGAVGFVVLMALVSLLWNSYQKSRDAEAQLAFSDAMERFHAPVDEADQADSTDDPNTLDQQTKYRFTTNQERFGESLEAFKTVADDYPRLWLGGMSRYYAGLSLVKLGRTEEAKLELQKTIDESSWVDVKNLARNALAQVAVDENDYERAAELYEQIVEEPSANLPSDLALIRLARNLELVGKTDEALTRYRQVTSEYAGSPSATAAQNEVRRLESLLGRETVSEEVPAETAPEELDS